jgi:hypothetical protein
MGTKKSERWVQRETHNNNETTPQYLAKHTMHYVTHVEAAEMKN